MNYLTEFDLYRERAFVLIVYIFCAKIFREEKGRYSRKFINVDFAILTDHRVKIKENEKRDKYYTAREIKKKEVVEYASNCDANC